MSGIHRTESIRTEAALADYQAGRTAGYHGAPIPKGVSPRWKKAHAIGVQQRLENDFWTAKLGLTGAVA